MTKLKKAVEGLVDQELQLASEEHGSNFHSAHEAYAVIQEEVDEAKDAMGYVEEWMRFVWDRVKKDIEEPELFVHLKEYAMAVACEAIQVAAMAEKALRGYEVDG